MGGGFQRLPGRLVVIGKKAGKLVELPPIKGFDGFGDRSVQRDQARSQLRRIGHLLDQRMAERQQFLIVGRQIVQQFRLPELRDRFQQLVVGQGCDRPQDRHRN